MSVFRFRLGGESEFVVGRSTDDVIVGGTGHDWLYGGAGGDTFTFRQGDGADRILDFTSGVDRLHLQDVSPFTVSYEDTAEGLLISYATMGGGGPDQILLLGVHEIAATDFDWG